MKPRSWILIVVVIVVVLFWILWPRPVPPVLEQKSEVPPTIAPIAQVPLSAQPAHPSSAQVLQQGNPEKLKQAQEREAKHIEALNRDIDFYGQTVDQDGHPLPGVQIKMVVPHFLPGIDGLSIHVNRTSDANGLFDIHDATVTGDAVDIESMSKEGYELEPTHRGWGPTGGAPGNPMIFRLWRNDIKEPLIAGREALDLLADGRLYVISITNDLIREGNQGNGDMTVWVKRPDGVTWSNRFDWSCELQMVNGGISEELDGSSAMYVAPTDVYSNDFYFDATNGWGKTTGARRFYLRLSNGNYGRASIEILSYFDHQIPGLIRIDYAINPTGSRILR